MIIFIYAHKGNCDDRNMRPVGEYTSSIDGIVANHRHPVFRDLDGDYNVLAARIAKDSKNISRYKH